MTAVLALAVFWVGAGLVTAFVMARRGHHLGSWIGLSVLGPLGVGYAIAVTDRESLARSDTIRLGRPAPGGTIDLLAGIDGSPEAEAAVLQAGRLLGPLLRRLTLAAVVDYDTSLNAESDPEPELVEARRHLGSAATRLEAVGAAPDPDEILLAGAPAEALARHAHDHGYDIVVIGPRGHGASKTILGSVAQKLADNRRISVLIAPETSPPRGPSTTPGDAGSR